MARRGENIYKRKDGRWEGRFIKEKAPSGKTKYGYVYAKTYGEVKDKLLKRKLSISSSNTTVTVSAIAYRWLDNQHHIKQATYVKYRNVLDNHICPKLGNYQISKCDICIVQGFIHHLLTEGNKSTNNALSIKSTRDILSILKNIFKFATECGVPCFCNFDNLNIKLPIVVTPHFDTKQSNLIMTYLSNNINCVNIGILLAFYTGIRIGELCALKTDDILFQDDIVHIDKTLQRIQTFSNEGKRTKIVITTPKSSSSTRDIPIPHFLVELIKNNMNHNNSVFILTGCEDKFMEPRNLENKFNTILKLYNIQEATFHTIRHTFATSCVEAGVDIKTLSEILGHSSVNITLNRYVHSTMENKRTNMTKLYSHQSFLPSFSSSLA